MDDIKNKLTTVESLKSVYDNIMTSVNDIIENHINSYEKVLYVNDLPSDGEDGVVYITPITD